MSGGLRELHLFAGAGGGILGGLLLGHVPVCAVELEEYPRSVLLQRQSDGILPWFPVWDDVRTFDGRPWRGIVDIVAGGFPCQDISASGRGAGLDGERSGLWREFARIVGQVRPRIVFVENSPLLTSRGLGRVLGDLATLGFDAEWGVLGADDAGAPHIRKRIWILAHTEGHGWRERGQESLRIHRAEVSKGPGQSSGSCGRIHAVSVAGRQRLEEWQGPQREWPHAAATRGDWWATEPAMGRVAYGVASRVDRLKAIGNGQVPAVAAIAFHELGGRMKAQGIEPTRRTA